MLYYLFCTKRSIFKDHFILFKMKNKDFEIVFLGHKLPEIAPVLIHLHW